MSRNVDLCAIDMRHQCHTFDSKRCAECRGIEVLFDDDNSLKPQVHQKKAGGTTKVTDISVGEIEVLSDDNDAAVPTIE